MTPDSLSSIESVCLQDWSKLYSEFVSIRQSSREMHVDLINGKIKVIKVLNYKITEIYLIRPKS